MVFHEAGTIPVSMHDVRTGVLTGGVRVWCKESDEYVDMLILDDRRDLALRQGLKRLNTLCTQALHTSLECMCD
jgi:hypothetical protein